jgi:hypothetical protein
MDVHAVSLHLDRISKSITEITGLNALHYGYWHPEQIKDNPVIEKNWLDGFDYTFYLIFNSVSDEALQLIQQYLFRKVNTTLVKYNGTIVTLITFGGGIQYFIQYQNDKPDAENLVEEKTILTKLPSRIIIPDWLDNIVFNELNARFAPNFKKFARNLELSEEDVKDYLGTYHLRSFGEAAIIMDNLLSNRYIFDELTKSNPIRILSIGSGTGGDLGGIISSIVQTFEIPSDIDIVSVDGNKHMLEYQKLFIDKLENHFEHTIRINTLEKRINTTDDLKAISEEVGSGWNIITTFKCLSEITSFPNIYYEFSRKFMPLLHEKGLMFI